MLRLATFPHGIHPREEKALTRDKPIEDFPLPAKVIIPLIQHTGAPNEPLVKTGDRVLTGQLIGHSQAFISAPVHASLSGEVLAIEPYPHPSGIKVKSIIIESDGKDEWIKDIQKPDFDLAKLTPEKIREIVRQAGIVGLGGAAFPTHVKLTPPKEKVIEYLLINGAECEPYLTSDERLMLEKSKEIVEGIKIIKVVLPIEKVFIAIELNKPECLAAMAKALNLENDIELIGLKTKYPQGGEKQLIKAVLGREVPRKGLPMDVGCLVHNIGTVLAIREAVMEGRPLIDRVVTVAGGAVSQPKNLRVRIGTPFINLLNFCRFNKEETARVIMGGPMMGISQYNLEVPVIKGTSGILAFKSQEIIESSQRHCIRCGRCVASCPVYLMPYEISLAADINNFALAEKLGVLDCIECGICSYVCPATRQMIHLMKKAKAYLR